MRLVLPCWLVLGGHVCENSDRKHLARFSGFSLSEGMPLYYPKATRPGFLIYNPYNPLCVDVLWQQRFVFFFFPCHVLTLHCYRPRCDTDVDTSLLHLHNHYHTCWWPGVGGSQVIDIIEINLDCWYNSMLHTWEVKANLISGMPRTISTRNIPCRESWKTKY